MVDKACYMRSLCEHGRMPHDKSSKIDYRLFQIISKKPEISQRALASELGLSLGKTNYCLKAFISRGLVKVNNFRRSDNKMAYSYLLTPKGIEEKTLVTLRFFRAAEQEYEALKVEVEKIEKANLISEEREQVAESA